MRRSTVITGRRLEGFTLIEVLIVVVILGILAMILVAKFSNFTDQTRQTAFVADMRDYATAAMLYTMKTGQFLAGAPDGVLPPGFDAYVNPDKWAKGTPIGGVWDVEQNAFGVTSSFGVHFVGGGPIRDDAFMTEVDLMIDDGDLNTGVFRKLDADRYYYVLVN
jgi:prepilin-type N-terminal cleavage/methylation domain-containing protein